MLVVTLYNILTDKDDCAIYDATVRVNYRTIWKGKVGMHPRKDGAGALLRRLANAMDSEPQEQM
jgi:hypothetical protein